MNLTITPSSVQFHDEIKSCFHWRDQPIAVLITPEFEGIFRNGGIGTYYLTLSEKFKQAGVYVILLITQSDTAFRGESEISSVDHVFSTGEWQDILSMSTAETLLLTQPSAADWTTFERYCVLAYVRALTALFPTAKFCLEFPEMLGLATQTIQAKQAGLLNDNCLIVVTLHSGHEWIQEAHGQYVYPAPQWLWSTAQAEQASFEQADVAFFLSHYLKEKVEGYGWRTAHAKHLPYCFQIMAALDSAPKLSPAAQAVVQSTSAPLVFFGRLETRKGILTFLEALQRLQADSTIPKQVIFLGKSQAIAPPGATPQDAQVYIQAVLGDAYRVYCLTELFREEAIALIRQLNNPIICLTSLQENFPNAAIEMGQLPVRLVVSNTGGYRETLGLIHRTDGVYWFMPGEVRSLAEAIRQAVQAELNEIKIPSPQNLQEINDQLLQKRWDHLKLGFGITTEAKDREWILGMTSMAEQKFLVNYAKNDYAGVGEIVELGCWLGSSTIPLAQGLDANSRVLEKSQRIHAYDIFVWDSSGYMEQTVMGTSLERKYQPGDSFLDEYLKRITPWQHLIQVYPGDLNKLGWQGIPIEFLFVDAMKSLELANSIKRDFFPALIPDISVVVHQDFAHFYTSWIHLIMYRLRDYFVPIDHPFMHSSRGFRYVKKIPHHLLIKNWSLTDFSVDEVEAAFNYSLEITPQQVKVNVMAAKVMYFVHSLQLDRAIIEFKKATSQLQSSEWQELVEVQKCAKRYYALDLLG